MRTFAEFDITTTTVVDIKDKFEHYLNQTSFPDGTTSILFNYDYHRKIDVGIFPNSVKTLKLPDNYEFKINIGVIPYGVETLIMSSTTIPKCQPGSIPDSVKKIQINNRVNALLSNCVLPQNLCQLEFRGHAVIDNEFIPKNLRELSLDYCCQSINFAQLPPTLEILKIKNSRDTILDCSLIPSSVHTLVLKSISRINSRIPQNVVILDVSRVDITESNLPLALRELRISNMVWNFKIPTTVETFYCNLQMDYRTIEFLSDNIKTLYIKRICTTTNIKLLPSSITSLIIANCIKTIRRDCIAPNTYLYMNFKTFIYSPEGIPFKLYSMYKGDADEKYTLLEGDNFFKKIFYNKYIYGCTIYPKTTSNLKSANKT